MAIEIKSEEKKPLPPGTKSLVQKIDFQKYNSEIKTWGSLTNAMLKQEVSKYNSSKDLYKSLKSKTRKSYAEITSVGFKLKRHGVFLQKGVGRGYQMQNGRVVRTAESEMNHKSVRFERDWFNTVMNQRVPTLEKIIIEHSKGAIEANTKRIYIL